MESLIILIFLKIKKSSDTSKVIKYYPAIKSLISKSSIIQLSIIVNDDRALSIIQKIQINHFFKRICFVIAVVRKEDGSGF